MHKGIGHVLTRWNQHNMSSYGIWGGWKNEGTMIGSSWEIICE